MKLLSILALTSAISTPAFAQETRQLHAHEHGVGQLNIAFDGSRIAMEFHVPGVDIVGFEHSAESAKDRAAIDAAVAKLGEPLALFELPSAAGCSVVKAAAGLESDEDHADEHDHEEHADEDHADEHDHEEHADEDHAGEHDHEEHAEGGHDENKAGHTEFHAEYLLDCADPAAATSITFAYFDAFPNALEVDVQLISGSGATSFEVERDAPTLDLRGKL